MEKNCCVVPANVRKNLRIQQAVIEIGSESFRCQFETSLPADQVYNSEYFCILHLPFKAKEENKTLFQETNEKFIEELKKYEITCYKFISAENLSIPELPVLHQLSFIGSELYSLEIKSFQINSFSLISTILCGTTKINGSFKNITIKDSRISSYFSIQSKVETLLIKNSEFHSSTNNSRIDANNYGIHLSQSKIDRFAFIENECDITLVLDNAEIEELELRYSKFSLCPSFFNTHFTDKNKNIILPDKDSFNIKKLIHQKSPSNYFINTIKITIIKKINSFLKSDVTNLKENIFSTFYKKIKFGDNDAQLSHYNVYMSDQYRKFREIYNITKTRGMFLEQSNYFYLMQCYFERTNQSGAFNSVFSKLYRFFSNYGQSTFKPTLWLIITWLFFGILYNDLLLSFKQIAKPYSIFFETGISHCRIMYILGFVESTSAIAFVALLLIALRWHFRKA